MPTLDEQILHKILDEARWYPSPHNSQPIRIKITPEQKLEVYYDLKCGLPAESFGKQFGYVCTGVFLSGLRVTAGHYGYKTDEKLSLKDMDFSSGKTLHYMGIITLVKLSSSEQPHLEEYRAFQARQTSRIPYDNRLVAQEAINDAVRIAKRYGHALRIESAPEIVKKIIDINQRTLFLDMENDSVYAELMEWLRFSKKQARAKGDGLSAETMLIPGPTLKFMMKRRKLWKMPVIGNIVKLIYLNTMRGVRQVAWLTGKFANFEDYVMAGKCFMDIWLCLTKHGIYIHPYGTVITNNKSHQAFTQLVGQDEEKGNMSWMLFRLGYSKKPPYSYRRPLSKMLIK